MSIVRKVKKIDAFEQKHAYVTTTVNYSFLVQSCIAMLMYDLKVSNMRFYSL